MRSIAACALLLSCLACTRLAEYGDPRLRPPATSPQAGEAAADPVVVRGKGTIRLLEEDGGFWGLRSDDGKRYRLSKLPPAFQKDGTRIRFEGRVRPGGGGSLWGTVIELTEVSGV